jgi:general secretion pathway protein I
LIEAIVVLAIMGLGLGAAVVYLQPIEQPLRAGATLVESLCRQARLSAIATTSAYRHHVDAGLRDDDAAAGWREPRVDGLERVLRQPGDLLGQPRDPAVPPRPRDDRRRGPARRDDEGHRVSERGFTLLEALIAMAILGIALAGLVPSFQAFMDANSLSEERSNAVAAAQEVMEGLRRADPASLPTSGTSAAQVVTVGAHEYEIFASYCIESSWCSTAARHVIVEVHFGGQRVYTVESVFTRLH